MLEPGGTIWSTAAPMARSAGSNRPEAATAAATLALIWTVFAKNGRCAPACDRSRFNASFGISMNVHFLLDPSAVEIVSAKTKQAIFELLAQRFAQSYGLDAAMVLDRLQERES